MKLVQVESHPLVTSVFDKDNWPHNSGHKMMLAQPETALPNHQHTRQATTGPRLLPALGSFCSFLLPALLSLLFSSTSWFRFIQGFFWVCCFSGRSPCLALCRHKVATTDSDWSASHHQGQSEFLSWAELLCQRVSQVTRRPMMWHQSLTHSAVAERKVMLSNRTW